MRKRCKGITKTGKICNLRLKEGIKYCCKLHEESLYPKQIKHLVNYILLENIGCKYIRREIYRKIFCRHTCNNKDKLHYICCSCMNISIKCKSCNNWFKTQQQKTNKTQLTLEYMYSRYTYEDKVATKPYNYYQYLN